MSTSKPHELFFGGVAAVGTPLEFSLQALTKALGVYAYKVLPIKLSEQARLLELPTPEPTSGASEFERVMRKMDRGNEARQRSGLNDVLARLAISVASTKRDEETGQAGLAFVFRQLKHPQEVYLFREVYDNGFHLIGIHSARSARTNRLELEKGVTKEEAKQLADRDEHENLDYGQRVRDTFHLSDVFISVTGKDADKSEIPKQIDRFVKLLFGDGIHTPTRDEYGMFLAWASGLRSAQLSRQVGAAILSEDGEVIALGANEVPKAGGGQYSEESNPDGRDHALPKRDSTDVMRHDMLVEVLEVFEPNWAQTGAEEREKIIQARQSALKNARIMNLTEFTRAVHAEMEAIGSAARMGVSLRGATLYTTTFPCHNCTKHIVNAGIARVVYIEPYPKSMARELHNDSIRIMGEEEVIVGASGFQQIPFEPFVGVGPRRFADLFSMATPQGTAIRRKDKQGAPLSTPAGLRMTLRPDSYLEREAKIADSAVALTLDEPRKND